MMLTDADRIEKLITNERVKSHISGKAKKKLLNMQDKPPAQNITVFTIGFTKKMRALSLSFSSRPG